MIAKREKKENQVEIKRHRNQPGTNIIASTPESCTVFDYVSSSPRRSPSMDIMLSHIDGSRDLVSCCDVEWESGRATGRVRFGKERLVSSCSLLLFYQLAPTAGWTVPETVSMLHHEVLHRVSPSI